MKNQHVIRWSIQWNVIDAVTVNVDNEDTAQWTVLTAGSETLDELSGTVQRGLRNHLSGLPNNITSYQCPLQELIGGAADVAGSFSQRNVHETGRQIIHSGSNHTRFRWWYVRPLLPIWCVNNSHQRYQLVPYALVTGPEVITGLFRV